MIGDDLADGYLSAACGRLVGGGKDLGDAVLSHRQVQAGIHGVVRLACHQCIQPGAARRCIRIAVHCIVGALVRRADRITRRRNKFYTVGSGRQVRKAVETVRIGRCSSNNGAAAVQ